MNNVTTAPRNLQLVPHALLRSHRYPQALHHWREAEFRAFLREDRFPACTLQGHESSRRQAVVKAVAQGLHVPCEVTDEAPELLAEGQAALARAPMNADRYEELKQARKLALDEFEKVVGYQYTTSMYLAGVKAILSGKLAREFAEIRKPSEFGKYQILLTIDEGSRAQYGPYGLLSPGRQKSLHVLFREQEDFWTLHKIEWQYVNDALFDLLCSGELSYDQVWFLTGLGWVPDQMRVTRVSVASHGERATA